MDEVEPVGHRRAVGLARSVVGGRADRHPAHRLDPAGDHHLHRARHHRLGAEVDRLLGRAALPVDGGAGDGVGKARGEGGVAPDVHGLLSDGHRAPVDDVFDQRGVEVVALDECAQRLGGEVDRVPTGEPPVPLPDRGPDDIDDHGARHDPIVSDLSWLPEIWRCVRFRGTAAPRPHSEQWTFDTPTTRRHSAPTPGRGWSSTPRPPDRSLPSTRPPVSRRTDGGSGPWPPSGGRSSRGRRSTAGEGSASSSGWCSRRSTGGARRTGPKWPASYR